MRFHGENATDKFALGLGALLFGYLTFAFIGWQYWPMK